MTDIVPFVSLNVQTKSDAELARAAEVIARAAAGLAMEGITVSVTMGQVDLDEEDNG